MAEELQALEQDDVDLEAVVLHLAEALHIVVTALQEDALRASEPSPKRRAVLAQAETLLRHAYR